MEVIKIYKPSRLEGQVEVQGSKNAALPMMAAAVMLGGKTALENCPDISDIRDTVYILKSIGCCAELKDNTLVIDSSGELESTVPGELMGRLRSSFLLTGAILSRCSKVRTAFPGGCDIGSRPVDIHLDAFRTLGAQVTSDGGMVECKADKIVPCDVHLRFPSVGATENIMILTARSKGTTRIINAACEPEIVDLQNMLNSAGARISGAGTPFITIRGVPELKDTSYRIMPDRIAAATYISAAACAGGEIRLNNARAALLSPYIAVLRQCGADIYTDDRGITFVKNARLKGGGINIKTRPYPGFATDMQSLLMSVMTLTDGVSIIQENIFENRFRLTEILTQMGADIKTLGRSVSIRGVRALNGVNACACDLRSGAALVAAALGAEGESEIGGLHYIDRGYENFCGVLASLGAKVERIEKA